MEQVEARPHQFSRIVCIVLDGVGVGEAPDADRYGDRGSDSLGNTSRAVGGLHLHNLGALGLGNIISIEGVPPQAGSRGYFGKMTPRSPGKDSTSGHWELMCCLLEAPFPTYRHGFPPDLVARFESAIGRSVIGNSRASGTEIIQTLGASHLKTGSPILYTSQDSVFQLAAHEDVIPPKDLYRMCETARALLTHPHNVARVIARPFLGAPGGFYRTPRRKDFSLPPPGDTVLDLLKQGGRDVIGIGKIDDLFGHRGLTKTVSTANNREGMDATLDVVKSGAGDFVFTNLVDFDMMWGHRNDPRAYALGLEEFDSFLAELLEGLEAKDLLIITSDHGCDPTTASTDHSREFVPLVAYFRGAAGGSLGIRGSFADAGKTVAVNFDLGTGLPGSDFLSALR
ncbi:MAG: phosphopentomutase [Chitinivibrionia bacterium]|nr:phosphopentomutase [Chitinivibrionia bacterium]